MRWLVLKFELKGIRYMGGNFIKIVLPPFCKGICSKRKERKEFDPLLSEFFLSRVDPF